MPSWNISDGRVRREEGGPPFIATGLNGGLLVSTPGVFGGPPGSYVAWAYDRYPGDFVLYTDPWPGDTNIAPNLNEEVFPGGLISPGVYWSQGSNNGNGAFVELPDRSYAMTGKRSAAAIRLGIGDVEKPWCTPRAIYRANCHLVPGPNTWNGASSLTLNETVPRYVAEAHKLLAADCGIVLAIEDHDQTGLDLVIPAALVADPMLPVAQIPSGPIQNSVIFYDAMCTAFQGNGYDVFMCLPNEPMTFGYGTNLTNNAALTQQFRDYVVTYLTRIRGMGYTGVAWLPVGRWNGEIGPLARGDYDPLIEELKDLGLWWNVGFELHFYGADYLPGAGGAGATATYAGMANYLAALRAKGIPFWVSECGRTIPNVTNTDIGLREIVAVDIMLGDMYGTPLAEVYEECNLCVWSTADNSFVSMLAITKGQANKADENAANPNTTGTRKGVYPWWDVTTDELEEEWCTSTGKYLRRLSRALEAKMAQQQDADVYLAYGSFSEFKIRLGITDSQDDARARSAQLVASRGLEEHCHRNFFRTEIPTTRVYQCVDPRVVIVDDFYTTEDLLVRVGSAATGFTALVRDVDYFVSPVNGTRYGRPEVVYWRIEAVDGKRLPTSDRVPNIEVTARWGWSSVPDAIVEATYLRGMQIFRRRDSPEGVLGGFEGVPVRVNSKLDPDLTRMVRDYVKHIPGKL